MASLFAAGCSSGNGFFGLFTNTQPEQVAPSDFVQRTPGNLPPQPNPLPANPSGPPVVSSELPVPSVTHPLPAPTKTPEIDRPGGISRVVQHSIQPEGEQSLNQPAPLPATLPSVGLASGQYLDLGVVVATVGSTPIYANEVLRPLAAELRNDARNEDQDQFANDAYELLKRQVDELEINEVNFQAARQNLDDDDLNTAMALARIYKADLITQAGGSIEVAVRRAAANGDDFDAMVYRQYRIYMTELYYQRKIYPLLQVGADDMRKYYRQHLADLNQQQISQHKPPFVQSPQLHFDLLAVSPGNIQSGNPAKDDQLALAKINEARQRAARGEDFANLFTEYNNDAGLDLSTQHTGDMGTIDRGSFAFPVIENAVWKLQPGQVTDVIKFNGEYYIAKLISKTEGYVRPFEDEEVQAAIRFRLQSDQFDVLRDQEQRRLLQEAIIFSDPRSMDRLLEMVMENYTIWRDQK
ncbi:MAG TPA: peptidyl-prolyl cis-trans isomerase [Tepidisphaeraceae bacterium]|nr:peptidyl-prolyl cis-trans isomerase [Tepidisphaeraceae bacterium]